MRYKILKNKLSKVDLTQIARIHKQELAQNGFISRCNLHIVYLFYKEMDKCPNCYLLTIKKDNTIQAFAFFTEIADKYFKLFLVKNSIQFFANPFTLFSIVKAILSSISINKKQKIFYKNELVYIAVKNEFKRKGLAQKLLEKGEKNFTEKQIFDYYLQVNASNYDAINFYKRNNFIVVDNIFKKNKILMRKILHYE